MSYHYVRITDNDSDVLPVCDYCGAYVAESEPHDNYHQQSTGLMLELVQALFRRAGAELHESTGEYKHLKLLLSSLYGKLTQSTSQDHIDSANTP